ncbi:hypothetical protein AU375_04879 [Methylobacterium radiotolerans]|nr:hypothetical protein AU375_04879 [Methylobacterium radiotolerans]
MLGLLDGRHHQAGPGGRTVGEQGLHGLPGPLVVPRVEGGLAEGETGLRVPDRQLRQDLGAGEAVADRVAGPQAQIDLGEVGVRIGLPGRLDDPGGLLDVAAAGEQASGDAGRRHEVGGELDRLQDPLRGEFRLAGLALAGDRGEEHRPLAPGRGLVDQSEGRAALDRLQGRRPVAVGALRLQQGLVGPGDARGEAGGLGGVGAGGRLVLAAPGLHEQAAQAQDPGLGIVDHALEGALGRVPVAGDLRRLRLEQQGQRLGAEEPLGVARVAAGRQGIAGAHRHHAAGEGREALGPAPLGRAADQGLGQADDAAHDRPEQAQDDRRGDHADEGDREAGADLVAVPDDGDGAGPVGDPDRPEGGECEQGQEGEGAPHGVSISCRRPAGGRRGVREERGAWAPARRWCGRAARGSGPSPD